MWHFYPQTKNVILFIGDGMGTAHRHAAHLAGVGLQATWSWTRSLLPGSSGQTGGNQATRRRLR